MAPQQFSPTLQRLTLLFVVWMMLTTLWFVTAASSPPLVYKKDFTQGYLLAQAFLSGVDPYQPLPALAQHFGLPTTLEHLNHPTPHPVAIGWLCLPFAWLPYPQAALAWLLFELLCLVLAVRWLLDCLAIPITPGRWLAGSALGLSWVPVCYDLYLGQLSLLLLVVWLGVWKCWQQGREAQGGALLGVLLSLKLMGWPVVFWLVWQRRWRGALAAVSVLILSQALAVALHGWALVQHYYTVIGPQLSAYYRTRDSNLSLWTLGTRLFAPFGFYFTTLPPIAWPLGAKLLTVLVPLAVVGLGIWWAGRGMGAVVGCCDLDAAFALLVLVSVLVSPVVWTHYLMMMIIPLGVVWQRLAALAWPRAWSLLALLLLCPLSVSQSLWSVLSIMTAAQTSAITGRPLVPYAAAWLTFLPTFAACALGWLLWRLSAGASASLPVASSAPTLAPLSSPLREPAGAG